MVRGFAGQKGTHGFMEYLVSLVQSNTRNCRQIIANAAKINAVMRISTYVIFLLSFVVWLLVSCSSPSPERLLETVDTVDEYGYTIRIQRRKDNKQRQGLYARIAPGGTLVEEAYYEEDSLQGLRILYYESGDTHIVETYRSGLFEGPFREYYEDGKLMQKGVYKNNEMDGEWTSYYPGGQISEVVNFKGNEENGPFIQYYPNGNIKAEGSYLNGDNEHGELKLYNEEGQHVRTMLCEEGRCRTSWSSTGDMKSPE